MNFNNLSSKEIEYIDLHGLTSFEAEEHLFRFLDNLPKNIRGLEVTHGYRRGTALKNMVKNSFHHPKISSKQVGLNPGITFFVLK